MLWSARGALPRFYADVLDVWRPWARDVAGQGVDASHFIAEDAPETTAGLLAGFLDHHLSAGVAYDASSAKASHDA